ncbi:hypothetical protein [Streptomyces sp. NPDC053542]|uniref:hypothetical protein n=1 Tax=Streptomyces sp. NPDC053542 TaxID=3365710 RepID=UPI0037CF7939
MLLRTAVTRGGPRVRWRGEIWLPTAEGGGWHGYALDPVPTVSAVDDDLRVHRCWIRVASGRCVDLGAGAAAPEAAVARKALSAGFLGAPRLVPVHPLERWLAVTTRRGRTALVRPLVEVPEAVVVLVQIWD